MCMRLREFRNDFEVEDRSYGTRGLVEMRK